MSYGYWVDTSASLPLGRCVRGQAPCRPGAAFGRWAWSPRREELAYAARVRQTGRRLELVLTTIRWWQRAILATFDRDSRRSGYPDGSGVVYDPPCGSTWT